MGEFHVVPHPVADGGGVDAEGAPVEDWRVLGVVVELLQQLLGHPGLLEVNTNGKVNKLLVLISRLIQPGACSDAWSDP